MANRMSQVTPQGNMHILQNKKKMQQGSPRQGPNTQQPRKSSLKVTNGSHSGDVVSDESEDGGGDGDDSANKEHSDDSDEEDEFALSGVRNARNGFGARLAGMSPLDLQMMDGHQSIAGAEQQDGNVSDEDDYGGIEDISDSEDSIAGADDDDAAEKKVLRSAEKELINEFERSENPRDARAMTSEMGEMSLMEDAAFSRRSSLQSDDSQQDDLDLDLDFGQDPFRGLSSHDDTYHQLLEHAEQTFDNDLLSSWRNPEAAISRENSIPSNGTQKKVRFEETVMSRSSSMSSDEDPREAFPDLFDSQDDQLVRQQMFLSGMTIDQDESEYEFDEDEQRTQYAIEDDSGEGDSDAEMTDSDTDDGETTDEEESPDTQLARVKAMKAARLAAGRVAPANSPSSAPATPVASKRSSPTLARASASKGRASTTKGGNRRPQVGTFILDPSKAIVTPDVKGRGVKMTCPKQPPPEDRAYWERAREAISSRDGSPGGQTSWTRSTPQAPSIPQRPLTSKLTLGNFFGGDLDVIRNHDDNGIAKELLSSARKGSMQESFTSSNAMSDDESDEVDEMNMEDFIDLADSEMEDANEPPSAAAFSPTQDYFNEALLDSPMHDNAPGLLDHLDQQRGLVGSFRANQQHARQVSALPANPARRAQMSEANALQQGRRNAANTPLTPARKKRNTQDVTGSGIKKIASPSVQKHRRSRGSSLSGTNVMLTVDRFVGKS